MANTTTTSTEGELLKEYWNETFRNELRASLEFYDLGLESMHGKHEGVMAHWLSLADLSADGSALTEATDPGEYALSAGDITANLAQFGGSVKVSDILQQTWNANSMAAVMERLARHAKKTIDTYTRNACFSTGGTAMYAGTAVARNSIATDGSFDLDVAELREAKLRLERNDVLPHRNSGTFIAITHPDCIHDIQGDSDWTNVANYAEMGKSADNRIVKGEAGTLYGIKCVRSTQALLMDASGSANTDVYQTYVTGDEHYGISKLQNVETIVKNPHPSSDLKMYGTAGWKCAFVAKELDSTRMIRIESGASFGD